MAGFLWVDVLPGEAREGTVSSGRWDTHLVTEVRRVWVTIREGPGLGSQAVGKGGRTLYEDMHLCPLPLQGLRGMRSL